MRDDALVARLRLRADNMAILDKVESTSAHGDLGEVVYRFAPTTGQMHVIPLSSAPFPALVATPHGSDVIVVAASGMSRLLIRVNDVPEGACLAHHSAPQVGPDWWHVNPFDRDVSIPDTAAELQRWFSAATLVT